MLYKNNIDENDFNTKWEHKLFSINHTNIISNINLNDISIKNIKQNQSKLLYAQILTKTIKYTPIQRKYQIKSKQSYMSNNQTQKNQATLFILI